MQKRGIAVMVMLMVCVAVGPALAAPDAALVARCAGCHGPEGVSRTPAWPSLAGQQQAYLAAQLRAFRAGSRSSSLMAPQARTLTDAQIDALAAHYAALPCTP